MTAIEPELILTKPRPEDPLISLIAPVLNEAAALDRFFEVVDEKLTGLRLEILFVDDGSTDDTVRRIVARSARDPRIKLLKLSRNFGKEAALTAGVDACVGDVAIPFDVDLQDPVEVVYEFLEKWREGYDVVYGVRGDRTTDARSKRGSASLFYRVFNSIADAPIPQHAGDFRLLDRSAVNALKQMPERVRFMKGLFSWVGFRQTEVVYKREPRIHGVTKFTGLKLVRLALDGFLSFSSAPLRASSLIGAALAVPSFLYLSVIIGKTLIFGVDVPGYASTISVVLFMGGVQLIILGVIGEYLSMMFTELKQRPIYIVDRRFENGRAVE